MIGMPKVIQYCQQIYLKYVNYRNTCLEIYELDIAKFLSAAGLAWQAASKKQK